MLLVVGILLAAFSSVQSFPKEEVVNQWDNIWPLTLNAPPNPHNSTFWGAYVPVAGWIELHLSFSGSVRVVVSDVHSDQTLTSIFDEVGTSFDEKVPVSANGTYQVDIKNVGSSPAEVDSRSSVSVKRNVTENRVANPYLLPGTLTACAGVVVLVVGFVTKPRKTRRKKSAVRS